MGAAPAELLVAARAVHRVRRLARLARLVRLRLVRMAKLARLALELLVPLVPLVLAPLRPSRAERPASLVLPGLVLPVLVPLASLAPLVSLAPPLRLNRRTSRPAPALALLVSLALGRRASLRRPTRRTNQPPLALAPASRPTHPTPPSPLVPSLVPQAPAHRPRTLPARALLRPPLRLRDRARPPLRSLLVLPRLGSVLGLCLLLLSRPLLSKQEEELVAKMTWYTRDMIGGQCEILYA